MSVDPGTSDLATLAEALRATPSLAVELAERALDARRPSLDAYVTHTAGKVRDAAREAQAQLRAGEGGPLCGLPVSVKDLYGVPGYPTYAGTPRALPDAFTRAGPVVQSLLQQGAVVTGKTHTVEFAFGGIGANAHWATPKNPWDAGTHRAPGGSSSGAAVSVVEGSASFALGTDTAGSVRIPASWNGLVGVKTTAGRWSTGGIVPLSHTLDTAGVLARTVADARWAFSALDPDGGSPLEAPPEAGALTLGVLDGPCFTELSPGVGEAVQVALRELESAGARVLEGSLEPTAAALELFGRGSVAATELWAFLRRVLPEWVSTLEPRVKQRVESAEQMSAREYLDRLHALETLATAATPCFDGFDALVMPTVANTPPPVSELVDVDAYKQANLLALRNTSVANTLRLCAVTVPVGKDAAGMPVGLMLLGKANDDKRLLQVAHTVERALGAAADRLGAPPVGS